jgi:competence protein ComEC
MTVSTLTGIVNQLLPEPHAGLLAGMLFGTRATLAPELTTAMIRSGTLHIVALSGMNITILMSVLSLMLLPFVSRRLTSLIVVLGITGFIAFVGPSPSVVRAGIMGSIGLFAIVFGKLKWGLLSLTLAVLGMLLLMPEWIKDLSFQLSVLATLGILLYGGSAPRDRYKRPRSLWQETLGIITRGLRDDLRITLSAQVFTIPLILFAFGRISLISPLANVLIGWTIAPLTVLGFIAVVAGFLWLPLSQVVAWFSWALLEYIVWVVRTTSTLPFASIGGF